MRFTFSVSDLPSKALHIVLGANLTRRSIRLIMLRKLSVRVFHHLHVNPRSDSVELGMTVSRVLKIVTNQTHRNSAKNYENTQICFPSLNCASYIVRLFVTESIFLVITTADFRFFRTSPLRMQTVPYLGRMNQL